MKDSAQPRPFTHQCGPILAHVSVRLRVVRRVGGASPFPGGEGLGTLSLRRPGGSWLS
jgi:hypothetical protein